MTDPAEHFRQQFKRFAPQLPGENLAWLQASRQAAMDQFAHDGYPTARLEDWKYARLTPLTQQSFQLPTITSAQHSGAIPAALTLSDTYQMVFVNGLYDETQSFLPTTCPGIRISRLAKALTLSCERIKSILKAPAAANMHGFNALNRAFAHDGVVIDFDAGQQLDKPLHVLFYNNIPDSAGAPIMLHPQVLITLANHAHLQLIETHAGTAPAMYLNNCATRVHLETGARLDHYKLQNEAPGAFHISSLDVIQGPDSQFTSHSASLGASLSRHEINVALDGNGAHCDLNGLFTGKDRQYVDYHTRIDHHQPHCSSTEHYKGVLGGHAKGVFNGRVYVHPHAQQTDAQQSNQNLLLSPTAEVDTKPQLEIYADDVKCSHGATTGQLDEMMLFYLRSRGIAENAAKALLTYGFAREIIDRIDVPAFHDELALALLDGMPGSEQLRSMIA